MPGEIIDSDTTDLEEQSLGFHKQRGKGKEKENRGRHVDFTLTWDKKKEIASRQRQNKIMFTKLFVSSTYFVLVPTTHLEALT